MIVVCFVQCMVPLETRAGHGSTEDSEIIAALVPSFSSSNEQVRIVGHCVDHNNKICVHMLINLLFFSPLL